MHVCFYLVVCSVMVIFLNCGCTDIRNLIHDSREIKETMADNAVVITYCAKEKTKENRVYFNYPQFQETTNNTTKINELIVEFIESELMKICDRGFKGHLKGSPENWIWNEDDYTFQAIDIDYQVTRNDSYFFSVIFEGMSNQKMSAHPHHYFNSLIIDLKNKQTTTLKEIYCIDDTFVTIVRKAFKEQIRANLAEKYGTQPEDIPVDFENELDYVSNYNIQQALKSDGSDDYGYSCFLTEDAVGISMPVAYTKGDHWEIFIDHECLDFQRK